MKKITSILLLLATLAYAEEKIVVPMYRVDEKGIKEQIGSVTITESKEGLVFNSKLSSIPEGNHGFHIHEKPDCGTMEHDGKMSPAGMAGGHYDPMQTKKHEGPEGDGHLGDLPFLVVNKDGTLESEVVAPRIKKISQIKNRSLMIHEGGDNYSDLPTALGGGGKRIACGIIE
ncbi:MAG: superoxide dismutase [Cu-Zn] SodC [Fusobacteriaceae bacterium]